CSKVDIPPATLRVSDRERKPFVLVNEGPLLEMYSTRTVLPPLARGLIADRPVVTRLATASHRPGTRLMVSRFRDVLRLVTLLDAPDVGLLPEISEIVASDPRWFVLRTSRDQIPILIDPERVTPRCLKAPRA